MMAESTSSDPIRVLQVIGIMNRGGAETMIMNLYRRIDRCKVQFDFVENSLEPAAFDEEILALGGRIYRCPHYNGKNHFSYVHWWKTFFREHPGEYPIVHGHLGSTAAIYLSIAKKHGAFCIAHSHSAGLGSLMYRIFSYPTRCIADQFLACSIEAATSRYGKKVGNDSNRCHVLNNAVDAKKFAFNSKIRINIRKKLQIAENAVVLGHVGRFVEAKNHLFLIDIFEKIHEKRADAILLLVGDGVLRPQIESYIQKKHLQGCVILAGVQSDTWNFYQAMDVFLMPSLYEGLPVSLVEAQTAGLPCCISDTIPREAAITDLVRFKSLDASADEWCDFVLRCAAIPRRNMEKEIQAAGYDISVTSKWLEDYYMGAVRSGG